MSYYTNSFKGTNGNYGFAADLDEELDDVEAGFAAAEAVLAKLLRAPSGEVLSALPIATSRAGKVLTFDADGDVSADALTGYNPIMPVILRRSAAYVLSAGWGSQEIEWDTQYRVNTITANHSVSTDPQDVAIGAGWYHYLFGCVITAPSGLSANQWAAFYVNNASAGVRLTSQLPAAGKVSIAVPFVTSSSQVGPSVTITPASIVEDNGTFDLTVSDMWMIITRQPRT